MIISVFNTILFNPLYNALVFLTNILPGHNIALAIILLTVIVKLVLFPLYHKSTKTQAQIKNIEPKLKKIKEQYKDDKQEQAKKTMELYREHGINPFISIGLLFVQLPIVLALFYVFFRGFELNLDILYSFVSAPMMIDTSLFGFWDIADKSVFLAILVGISQYIQMRLALPPIPKSNKNQSSFKDDFARSMNIQMRYVMPVVIIFIASSFPIAISLYWLTSNIFAIGHELVVKRKASVLFNQSVPKSIN